MQGKKQFAIHRGTQGDGRQRVPSRRRGYTMALWPLGRFRYGGYGNTDPRDGAQTGPGIVSSYTIAVYSIAQCTGWDAFVPDREGSR